MGWGWGKSCGDGVGMGTKYFTVSVSNMRNDPEYAYICVLYSVNVGMEQL